MSPVVEDTIKSKKEARLEKKRLRSLLSSNPADNEASQVKAEVKKSKNLKSKANPEETIEAHSEASHNSKEKTQPEDKKSKKQKKNKDLVELKEEDTITKTLSEKEENFDFVEAGFSFAPVSSEKKSKNDIEDDGLKIIEPKINKKKLTVDDITAIDKEKEEKDKKRESLEKRSQHAVWVGNLRFFTDEASLKQFFSPCGPITRVNLPIFNGKNKGFAFVDFENEESVEKAIALSEQDLDGRKLLIKNAKNFKKDGAKPPPKKAISGETDMQAFPTLFIGNLSFFTTKEGLQDKFSKFGEIKKIRISTFEDSGRCKGYAWIDFKTQEAATLALRSTQKLHIDGRLIKVAYAKENSVQRGFNLPQDHPNLKKSKAPEKTSQEVVFRGSHSKFDD